MGSLFLRDLPALSLSDAKAQMFITDFPEPRPSFEHAKLWAGQWRAHIVEKIAEATKRKNCAVSYAQFVVDHQGFLGIVCFTHPIIIGNAKSAAWGHFQMPS